MTQTTPPQPKVISLSLLLYRCLLYLGPDGFRRDYGAAALQDFRQCCRDAYQHQGAFGVLRLWPGLLGETIPGLLAEYWTEYFRGKPSMLSSIHRSLVLTFWAFILFSFAFLALMRTVDPVAPFNAVGHNHPEVALAYTLFAHSGAVALLTVLLGGFPLLFSAVKASLVNGLTGALKLFLLKPKQALVLFGVGLLITCCFVAYLLGTAYLFGSPSASCSPAQPCLAWQSPGMVILDLAILIAGLSCGVFVMLALGTALSLAVLRSAFGAGMLRFALVPIGILALTMATATGATIIWTIRLWMVAPQFAASASGLGNGQTAWVIAIIAAMTFSTLAATGAFTSGLRAQIGPSGVRRSHTRG